MGQDPNLIRAEIEQTRAEMGDTVDALGYKADVKTRAKESLQDKTGFAKQRVAGASRSAVGLAQENPLGLAVGSVAIGFVAGLIVPATRVEDEKLGDVSDQVTEKVKETGQEALEHGKQIAQETAQSAQRHGEEVKRTAQENVQDAASQATS